MLLVQHKIKIIERTVVLTNSLKFKEKKENRGRKKDEQKREATLKPRDYGAR
jgi:hypothetical protein